MEDIKLLVSTASSVLRDNKQLRAVLGCGALALVLVLALLGGMSAALSGGKGAGEAGAQQAGADAGSSGDEAVGTPGTEASGDLGAASGSDAADASLATTPISETGPYDILCGYSWADASTGAGYNFAQDGTLTLSYASAEGRTQKFAVGDAKKSEPTSTESGTGGTVTKTVYTFILTLDSQDPKTATLTVLERSGGDPSELTLSSSAFTCDLVGSAKTDAVEVEDLTGSGKLGEVVDEVAMSQALATWCRSNAVGTTKATWDGKASVDYATGTASISLKLNNTTQKKVTCSRDSAGNYTFN